MRKLFLFILPFALIFLSCTKAGKTEDPGNNYSFAPNFTLRDLKGNEISLSDYRDKIVILNFWTTWCKPCRIEIPGFVEIYEEYKDKGMEILGISLDRAGSKQILKFVEENKMSYPVLLGTKEIAMDYEIQVIPITFIIDKKGKTRHKHIGYMDKSVLRRYFLELVSEYE